MTFHIVSRTCAAVAVTLCLQTVAVGAAPAAADTKFLRQAALDGQFDIQSARLAKRLADNGEVKNYAARIVGDKRRIENALKKLAVDKHIKLPVGPGDTYHAILKKLAALKGIAFDRAYLEAAGPGRQAGSIEHFEQAAKRPGDADVRAFAQEMLPVLKEHEALAKNAAQSLPR